MIGRNLSTIIREIQRNSRSDGRYVAQYAQKKAIERRYAAKVASRKIENDLKLKESIITHHNLCLD
jgi:IS30 family transposase